MGALRRASIHDSDGLARARRLGVPVTADGIDGLVQMPAFDDIAIVFDATSAGAHARHDAVLRSHSKQIVDLTPAAIGPYLVPAVNMPRARRSAEREPRHLRRAGDDSDRRGDRARRAGTRTPRSSPASRASRPVRARARTSTSSRGRPRAASSASVARARARRSSC